MKKLLNYDFEYVQDIVPELDYNEQIKEFSPQSLYRKKENSLLHQYGDGSFCCFSIQKKGNDLSGVYALYIEDELVYIGQATNFAKRLSNNGYGNISPSDCYIGGQSTSCKINKVVLNAKKQSKRISLYFYITTNYNRIKKDLIMYYKPKFNGKIKNIDDIIYFILK